MPRPTCFPKGVCLQPFSSFQGTTGKKQCIVALGLWCSRERTKAANTYGQTNAFMTVPVRVVSKD